MNNHELGNDAAGRGLIFFSGYMYMHVSARSMMDRKFEAPFDRDTLLENFAAELAQSAYCVALRTKPQGTWLDLELDLWRALADTMKTGRGKRPLADCL
jgi:hypothetical protein